MIPDYINEFLGANPFFALVPIADENYHLEGTYKFDRTYEQKDRIVKDIELEIIVKKDFPKSTPIIKEIGSYFPKTSDYHVSHDGSLCLGSPARLIFNLSLKPNLVSYIEDHLDPFLYSVIRKIENKTDFIFGELKHGAEGEIEDYMVLFKVKTQEGVFKALKAISKKRKFANKLDCPCGCSKKLGQCKYKQTLDKFRVVGYESMYKSILNSLLRYVNQAQHKVK